MNAKNLIVHYLDEARLMQLATTRGDQPWCCTLYFAHDNLHNLYWLSLPDTRHSEDIKKNPNVAGTVVLPSTSNKPPVGLQFQGTAREIIDDDEISSHIAAYSERYNSIMLADDINSGKNPHCLYQIRPERFILYDVSSFPDQPLQEWQLPRG